MGEHGAAASMRTIILTINFLCPKCPRYVGLHVSLRYHIYPKNEKSFFNSYPFAVPTLSIYEMYTCMSDQIYSQLISSIQVCIQFLIISHIEFNMYENKSVRDRFAMAHTA